MLMRPWCMFLSSEKFTLRQGEFERYLFVCVVCVFLCIMHFFHGRISCLLRQITEAPQEGKLPPLPDALVILRD